MIATDKRKAIFLLHQEVEDFVDLFVPLHVVAAVEHQDRFHLIFSGFFIQEGCDFICGLFQVNRMSGIVAMPYPQRIIAVPTPSKAVAGNLGPICTFPSDHPLELIQTSPD